MKKNNINGLIYWNYLKSALIPIVVIELALLILYFGINRYIAKQNQETLLDEASKNIKEIASREVSGINRQLEEVNHLAQIMQSDHESFFANMETYHLSNGEPKFGVHANGVYYKLQDNGGASLYYSSTTAIGEEEKRKARNSEVLDPLLKSIVDKNPIVTQAYLNTWDDMNRLYPFMEDAPGQYGDTLQMEDYNFYYEADAEHNPKRLPVWTDAYLDPAGQGWMISVVVPVYKGDFLEGVSGLDVTIESFVEHVLDLDFPWNAGTFMVDEKGKILAMQDQVGQLFNLKELGEHTYVENIKSTIEKPEEFDLFKSGYGSQLAGLFESKERTGSVSINGVNYLVSQETVGETGWRMMTLVEKSKVFSPVTKLRAMSIRIGYMAVAVMVLFYALFFVLLLVQSRRLAGRISKPIEDLAEQTKKLSLQLSTVNLTPSGITELDNLGENFNTMTLELGARTDALIFAKQEADDANQAKSEFLANMSHELRTPIGGIVGMLHLALKSEMTEQQRNYVEKAHLSADRLRSIVDDILDFSKIEAGKLEMEHIDFYLHTILNQTLTPLMARAKEKNVDLLVKVDRNVPKALIGDPLRLEQVLINLIENAVKFSDKGGDVELKVALKEETDSTVCLQFSVRDKGIGISPEQQKKLFKAFSQADGSITRNYGGTGLGLIISQRLIQMMGGDIELESELGVGSSFIFTVRMEKQLDVSGTKDEQETGDNQRLVNAQSALKGTHILLVEDNEINQEMIKDMLSAYAIDVDVAGNGKIAIEMLGNKKYDGVFMDGQMPLMDGYAATRAIRKQKPV